LAWVRYARAVALPTHYAYEITCGYQHRVALFSAWTLRCSVVTLRRHTGTVHTNVRVALPRSAVNSKCHTAF